MLVKKLFGEGKTREEIKCITDCSKQTIAKYIQMKDENVPSENTIDSRGKLHIESTKKVQEQADWCRELKEEGYSLYRIAKETGFTLNTIKNYLSTNFTPVNTNYGNRRRGL